MINLDYQSRTPIYEQIVSEIEKYVALGILKEKEQIMSIRELASNLGVNPNTVQKALAEIENQKLIYTERTNGKFVTENEELIENVKKELANQKVQKYFQDMNKLGINKEEAITYLQGK